MWFYKLTSSQKKEWKINHDKMNEAENARAIEHPGYRGKSYSAMNKPYNRTNYGDLSPKSIGGDRDGKEMETKTQTADSDTGTGYVYP